MQECEKSQDACSRKQNTVNLCLVLQRMWTATSSWSPECVNRSLRTHYPTTRLNLFCLRSSAAPQLPSGSWQKMCVMFTSKTSWWNPQPREPDTVSTERAACREPLRRLSALWSPMRTKHILHIGLRNVLFMALIKGEAAKTCVLNFRFNITVCYAP